MFTQDIDIAAQLVQLGHAVYIDEAQSAAASTSDSPGQQVTEAAR